MEKTTPLATQQHSAAPSFSAHSSSDDYHLRSKMKSIRTADTARVGVTSLALLMGLTVLGTSANTLRVYEDTHVASDHYLPLWPENFNIQPTVSLVIGSVFVVIASMASVGLSRLPSVRTKPTLHASASLALALVGLVVSLISVIFFYAVNASETVDTFASWTCRWRDIPMGQQPHWDTLCQQSYAGLYLAILLIPVEATAVGLAAWQGKMERYVERYQGAKKSPALS